MDHKKVFQLIFFKMHFNFEDSFHFVLEWERLIYPNQALVVCLLLTIINLSILFVKLFPALNIFAPSVFLLLYLPVCCQESFWLNPRQSVSVSLCLCQASHSDTAHFGNFNISIEIRAKKDISIFSTWDLYLEQWSLVEMWAQSWSFQYIYLYWK